MKIKEVLGKKAMKSMERAGEIVYDYIDAVGRGEVKGQEEYEYVLRLARHWDRCIAALVPFGLQHKDPAMRARSSRMAAESMEREVLRVGRGQKTV